MFKQAFGRPIIKRVIFIILAAPLLLSISFLEGSTDKKEDIAVIKNVVKAEKQQGLKNGDNTLSSMTDTAIMEKEMYRNIYTKNFVVDYYAEIAGSRDIAELILMYADNYNLPYSKVFALVWTESKFLSGAVNYNKDSVDRGLFQLNSRSFPELSESDFFDIEKNIMYGTRYLKWCFDNGENYIVALAMYNAGKSRVERNSTPRMTLDYISRILSKQQEIESGFKQHLSVCMRNTQIALFAN